MPLNSYAPGARYTLLPPATTVGLTNAVPKVPSSINSNPVAVGSPPIPPQGVYPAYGHIGQFADAGDVADCLNQLVARIEALEGLLSNNPAYGIVAT